MAVHPLEGVPTLDEWRRATRRVAQCRAGGEAARLPPNNVYGLIQEGKLPALRFPVRIRRRDLDTLFERCRIKPGEQGLRRRRHSSAASLRYRVLLRVGAQQSTLPHHRAVAIEE